MHVSGPMHFKPMFFKGQLKIEMYCNESIIRELSSKSTGKEHIAKLAKRKVVSEKAF